MANSRVRTISTAAFEALPAAVACRSRPPFSFLKYPDKSCGIHESLTVTIVTASPREIWFLLSKVDRLGLAFVPQTENIFTTMSIEENLVLAGHVVAPAERRARVEAMFALFPDLAARRRLAAGRLSGGQRQMLAVARALMIDPTVLMLDEPSAGLSPKLTGEVFAKLAEIRRTGVTILLVEQNARAALAIADRAYILADGRNRHEGPAASLAADPEIAAHYLGLGGADDLERTRR